MKKFTIMLLLLLSALTVFAACGGNESRPESKKSAEAQESAEIHESAAADENLPLRHVEISIKDYGTVPEDQQPVIEYIRVLD